MGNDGSIHQIGCSIGPEEIAVREVGIVDPNESLDVAQLRRQPLDILHEEPETAIGSYIEPID